MMASAVQEGGGGDKRLPLGALEPGQVQNMGAPQPRTKRRRPIRIPD